MRSRHRAHGDGAAPAGGDGAQPGEGFRSRLRHEPPDSPGMGALAGDSDGQSDWLVPFTDLTMLLLVFFVIMVTLAEPATDTRADAADEARATAGQDSLLDSGRPWLLEGGGGLTEVQRARGERLAARIRSSRLDAAQRDAEAFVATRGMTEMVAVKRTDRGVRLRLADRLLFPSGSAAIQPRGRRLLDRLLPLLADFRGRIEVEGHTDDVPIRTSRFPSNWELSAARAIAVVRQLTATGLAPDRLMAVGYGETRPIAPNTSTEGRARNRRVAIVLVPRSPGEAAQADAAASPR